MSCIHYTLNEYIILYKIMWYNENQKIHHWDAGQQLKK
jgi:hypothetical protein